MTRPHSSLSKERRITTILILEQAGNCPQCTQLLPIRKVDEGIDLLDDGLIFFTLDQNLCFCRSKRMMQTATKLVLFPMMSCKDLCEGDLDFLLHLTHFSEQWI